MEKHNELNSAYDVIARSWKGDVVFTGETENGKTWISRHWGDIEFRTHCLINAAQHIKKMNSDGLEVALLCGV